MIGVGGADVSGVGVGDAGGGATALAAAGMGLEGLVATMAAPHSKGQRHQRRRRRKRRGTTMAAARAPGEIGVVSSGGETSKAQSKMVMGAGKGVDQKRPPVAVMLRVRLERLVTWEMERGVVVGR